MTNSSMCKAWTIVLFVYFLPSVLHAQSITPQSLFNEIESTYDSCYSNQELFSAQTISSFKKGSQDLGLDSLSLIIDLYQGKLLYERGENQEALALLNDAIARVGIPKQIHRWARIQLLRAAINYHLHEYEEADNILTALLVYQDQLFPKDRSALWVNIGLIKSMDRETSEEALEAYHNALDIYENMEPDGELVTLYSNIASLLINNNDFSPALNYLQKALEISSELQSIPLQRHAAVNLGVLYKRMGSLDLAEEHFRKVIAFDSVSETVDLARVCLNLGGVLNEQNRPEEALFYFEKCLAISTKLDSEIGIFYATTGIGSAYFRLDEFEKALGYYLKAKASPIYDADVHHSTNVDQSIIITQEKLGDFQNAYFGLIALTDVRDSLNDLDANNRIAAIEREYDQEKNQLEIARLENDVLESKNDLTLALFIGALVSNLLLLSVFFIWRKRRSLQNSNELLSAEMEIVKINLKHKEEEIVNSSIELARLNDCTQRMDKYTAELVAKIEDKDDQVLLRKLRNEITSIVPKSSWTQFLTEFENVHPNYIDALKGNHPDLNQMEIKVCCFIKLDLTNRQIASILNKSKRTIEGVRTSIRSKVGLEGDVFLKSYLAELG